jgi:hypothetical protein
MPSHPPYTLSSLTTLTMNRSTATPVKAWQNRPLQPGTASGEGPKSRSLQYVTVAPQWWVEQHLRSLKPSSLTTHP